MKSANQEITAAPGQQESEPLEGEASRYVSLQCPEAKPTDLYFIVTVDENEEKSHCHRCDVFTHTKKLPIDSNFYTTQYQEWDRSPP